VAALDELLIHLSDDQNVKGRQFEDLCYWYLTHDPKYAAVLKRLWRWESWPGRRGDS
jgi:predicted helicase